MRQRCSRNLAKIIQSTDPDVHMNALPLVGENENELTCMHIATRTRSRATDHGAIHAETLLHVSNSRTRYGCDDVAVVCRYLNVSKRTPELRNVCALLRSWLHLPGVEQVPFTSISFNKDYRAKRHRDKGNEYERQRKLAKIT